MANETKTVNKETGSNLTPIIIIGAIFLATVFGIYMISQSGGDPTETTTKDGKTATNSGETAKDGNKEIPNYNAASLGASPANFKGSENATVVLEEFADFQCPTCRTIHPVINEVISKYGNRIKVIFRQFPITQMHPKAYDAAVATEAAGLQGKFWEMQNIIFNNQTNWANSQNHKQDFAGYAKTIGLDIEKFNNDMLGLQTKSRVDADMKRGNELGIQSTPSIIINGTLVNFANNSNLAGLSKTIDAELAKSQPKDDSQTKPSEENSDKKAEDAVEEKDKEKSDK